MQPMCSDKLAGVIWWSYFGWNGLTINQFSCTDVCVLSRKCFSVLSVNWIWHVFQLACIEKFCF